MKVHRAYEHVNSGDLCSEKKDRECAVREYGAAREPRWIELTGRLPAAGLLPEDAQLLARIRAQATRGGPGQ